jgi:hypothetical protein
MAGGGSSSCCHEARNRRAATAAGQGKKARARPPVVAVEVEANGMASRTFLHVGGKTMTPRNSHMALPP